MTLHTWLLFTGTMFLLSGTSGPNMLHVMTRSSDGVRGRGAPMTNLSHTTSFHFNERIAPSWDQTPNIAPFLHRELL